MTVMTEKKQSLGAANPMQVNLAPGFAVLVLSVAATILGFAAGVKMMPFGSIAIVVCLFSAVQMIHRRSATPGYTSIFLVMPVIAAALLLPF